jgi:hypothetical protein
LKTFFSPGKSENPDFKPATELESHLLPWQISETELEGFLFPAQIGNSPFQTCQIERKSSFPLADWKPRLENFLFTSQIRKVRFQTFHRKRKSSIVATSQETDLEDLLFFSQVGKDGVQTFHGKRRLEVPGRKSSFTVADWKAGIEDSPGYLGFSKLNIQLVPN